MVLVAIQETIPLLEMEGRIIMKKQLVTIIFSLATFSVNVNGWNLSRRQWLATGAASLSPGLARQPNTPLTVTVTLIRTAQAANLPTSYAPPNSVPLSMESLIPIVQLQQTMQTFQQDLNASARQKQALPPWPASLPSTETALKALLDAYSVPVSYKQRFLDSNAFLVYYTKGFDGPGRPNIETVDDLELLQTQQYGARNDVWIALQNVIAEYHYALQHLDNDDEVYADVSQAVQATATALQSYLDLVPPAEYQRAKASIP